MKKLLKKFQKSLDKGLAVWYNNRVAPRKDPRSDKRDRSLKIEQQQEYKAQIVRNELDNSLQRVTHRRKSESKKEQQML